MTRPFEEFFKGQAMMNRAERNFRREQRKIRDRLVWDIQMAEREGDMIRANALRDRVMQVNQVLRG